ncbi:MAG: anhydro-N-acetylmuramic acid kinase [Acidobacteriia bacterium]|nr:anhydro-N-acetylmuramic acid kinase [Terriglobia bacterium]
MRRIIGLMSGTSADGVDAAVVDVWGKGLSTRFRMAAFESIPYPKRTRQLILSFLNARGITVAEISQLNFLIGHLFAEAVLRCCRRHHIPLKSVDLVGSHGQTVYHQSVASSFGGRAMTSTLQLGEPAVIAERTRITTISDFRVRDVAAGGTGAPLVPYVDYLLLRSRSRNRVALNVGGIANLTLIPRNCRLSELRAFDTGPGNMMMDAAVAIRSRGKLNFDRHGALASRGRVIPSALQWLLKHPFYRRRPPKAAGREQFGIEYTEAALRRMRSARVEDVLATLVELTVRTILSALEKYAGPSGPIDELIVSGGGARNRFLMSRLQFLLPETRVMTSSEVGIDLDAKEAIAFALLANETWHHQPANVPSVTGAHHPVILGKITLA